MTVILIDFRGQCARQYIHMQPSDEEKLYRMVAQRIRDRRKALKMTQAGLATEARVLRTSVANIEAARQRPPLHVLYSLCSALKTDVHTILPSEAELREFDTVELNTQGGVILAIPEKTAEVLRRLLQTGLQERKL